MPPVVIIGHFRYANANLISVAHDWLEDNGDFSGFEGMLRAEAFHIVPDRGMGLFFFDTKESAQAALFEMKQRMRDYAQMFEYRVSWELGFMNETLSKKISQKNVASKV